MENRITSFSGDFRFLSNFWFCDVNFEGIKFPSSEHAYVAAKTNDMTLRSKIATIETSGKVKSFGRKMAIRDDWELVKLDCMNRILCDKFSLLKKEKTLCILLEKTRDTELIEGNTWGDVFWGQCPIGVGENNLGKLLMKIRKDNREAAGHLGIILE